MFVHSNNLLQLIKLKLTCVEVLVVATVISLNMALTEMSAVTTVGSEGSILVVALHLGGRSIIILDHGQVVCIHIRWKVR